MNGFIKRIKIAPSWLIALQIALCPCHYGYSMIPERSKSINFQEVKPAQPTQSLLNLEKLNKYVPPLATNKPSGELLTDFQNGFASRLTDDFFRSDYFRKSGIGKITTEVEKAAQQSIVLNPDAIDENGREKPTSPTVPDFRPPPVVHKINLRLQVYEKYAVVNYSGFFNVDYKLKADTNTADLDISRPIANNTFLGLHNSSQIGTLDQSGEVKLTYTF